MTFASVSAVTVTYTCRCLFNSDYEYESFCDESRARCEIRVHIDPAAKADQKKLEDDMRRLQSRFY